MLGVVEERKRLTHDLRIAQVEREKMVVTMEPQTARIQELEVRVFEERQRADVSHAQFQATEGRLIRIVEEAGNHVDGIMLSVRPWPTV